MAMGGSSSLLVNHQRQPMVCEWVYLLRNKGTKPDFHFQFPTNSHVDWMVGRDELVSSSTLEMITSTGATA